MVSTCVSPSSAECALTSGRLADARHLFWTAAQAADRAGDSQGLAEAALGLGGLWINEHRSTLERARVSALQQRALEGVDPASAIGQRLRARLLAEHAYATGDRVALLAELDEVRQRADPVGLAEALSLAHHCLLGPHDADRRLALADELVMVSSSTGRTIDGLMGLAWRTVDFFLAGDRRSARSLRELRESLRTERCDALRYLVAALDVTIAMRAGHLVEAERLAEACYEIGEDVGDADAMGWYGAQIVAIRWMQGRGHEILPLVRELDEATSVAEINPAFAAATASLAASAGDVDTAQAALARVGAVGLANVPRSSCWLVTLTGVCDAAFTLGDAAMAQEAYSLLEPFADRPVMASLGVACYGSTNRPLGLAAAAMGDNDLAIRHFEAALVADRAIGNEPSRVIGMASLADALDRRADPEDMTRAAGLRCEAIADAERLGLTERARQWANAAIAPSHEGNVEFQREGRLWTVRVGQRVAAVPHNVGMNYLAELTAHPDVEIPAVELATAHTMAQGVEDHHEVLDPEAKAAYRKRIEELRSDIDDADTCADLERASRARLELDRFIDELGRATGLGDRTRSFAHSSERARVSVRKAIARALTTIADADEAVAKELAARIVTGGRCVFLRQAPST